MDSGNKKMGAKDMPGGKPRAKDMPGSGNAKTKDLPGGNPRTKDMPGGKPRTKDMPGGDNLRSKGMPAKENPIAGVFRVLKYVLADYKWSCIFVFLMIIVTCLAILALTMFIQQLIDGYILPMCQQMADTGSADFAPLAFKLCQLGVIALCGVAAAYGYNRIMVNVTNGTLLKLRKNLFKNMESLPLRYFDTTQHGDTMSVFTNDIDTLRQVISQSMPSFINSFFSALVSLIAMFVLNVPLAFVCIACVVVMLFITIKLGGMSSKYFKSQQDDLGAVNGFIEEMMTGQKVVKCFCHEQQNIEDFTQLNEKLRKSATKANTIANIIMPINGNMGNLTYVLVAVVGGIFALGDFSPLTVGTLVAFLSLSRGFTQPVTQISMQVGSIVMAGAGAGRLFKLYDQKPEEDAGTCSLKKDKIRGEVIFDHVNFSYTPDKQILHDINMFAKPGQKLAFVGSTGAGKTTITNLINRFYDIDSGSITFDGTPIKDIKKSDLRQNFGIVLQDTHLFSTTVLENIRYGRLDATDEECIAAAKATNAHEFIERMSNGYQTKLRNDGTNLSQGQRQLIAIARAAVADPPVMILDEATSSIDTRTELAVQAGMDALMKDRTSFVIAHRLSTVRDADCIMVMEEGRIIERGTHQELLEQKGRYYHLYTGK